MGHQVATDQGLISKPPAAPSVRGRRGAVSAFFAPKRKTRLVLLLSAPMLWLVVAYLGSIGVLLTSALWTTDFFTGNVAHTYSIANLHEVYTQPLYRNVAVRTILVALLVTVIDALIAFPMAFYMSKIASPRMRKLLVVAVLTPLWASYLVKAYAWRSLLAPNGPLSWLTGGHTPGYGLTATVITLSYLWLPYMVIPVYAGFERVPRSLFEASADLGAGAGRTVRSVLIPMVFPAIAAGSIFTFSLTLGDYIAVGIVGGKTQLLANVIYGQLVTANNQPLAAALSTVPLVAIVLYLLAMRRTGALENV
ncbi:MAG: putative spermidine/putrescine transport system permease protein [Pseudonocardiales bacterium]|nr:putative spermidine/putrescine transport system permease protein [Pseudonocardiales bacterium]